MATSLLGKRKRSPAAPKHPYLAGNFAPIHQTCPLTPCKYSGSIPQELLGGQYVRNGGNPVSNEDLGRDAHWFDGDGMLSGVLFRRKGEKDGHVQPEFVNQYILTDVLLSSLTSPSLKAPILPSIATLVNPMSSLLRICVAIFRAILLVLLSWLPGSEQVIKKISVANTAIIYHDGRALATCESGPPMRISLPSLETVGWFNGNRAEGEPALPQDAAKEPVLGGDGLLSFMKEWTTAHPRVDPVTNEMIMFHSTFAPPYIHYSVIPATHNQSFHTPSTSKILSAPVSGVASAKMMHDFGVSSRHTVIMDLPLSLDPLQLAKNKAVIEYDSTKPSRFGVFPRQEPTNVRWFETSACCIFHTANTWDVVAANGDVAAIDMLTCRQTSATVVFSAGNLAAPQPTENTVQRVLQKDSNDLALTSTQSYDRAPLLESPGIEPDSYSWGFTPVEDRLMEYEEEQCRLYYYSFDMTKGQRSNRIAHQFALSAIPFEFPSVRPDKEMSSARYVYGCTTATSSFNAALGRAVKIDGLVKFDVETLIARGKRQHHRGVTGCVDKRTVAEIVAAPAASDTIQIFQMPENMYCQEPRFVPSASGTEEDSGFLLSYVFNEAQLLPDGEPPSTAVSELWIIDAKGMKDVLARIYLPQRVPYGLHGSWFPEEQVDGQRPVESVRKLKKREEYGRDLVHRSGRRLIDSLTSGIGG